MQAFWPGPLTLIVPRRAGVARGRGRRPGHHRPALPGASGGAGAAGAPAPSAGVPGVAGPSANRFGRVSPTTARARAARSSATTLLVLDGGAVRGRHRIDHRRLQPRRAGAAAARRAHARRRSRPPAASRCATGPTGAPDPRASGTLESHYAPQRQGAADGRQGPAGRRSTCWARVPPTSRSGRATVLSSRSQRLLQRRMPDDAAAAARQLFAVLRELRRPGRQADLGRDAARDAGVGRRARPPHARGRFLRPWGVSLPKPAPPQRSPAPPQRRKAAPACRDKPAPPPAAGPQPCRRHWSPGRSWPAQSRPARPRRHRWR